MTSPEKRHTYANYLAREIDEEELRQIRKLFDHCLTNRTVAWTTTQVYLVADVADTAS